MPAGKLLKLFRFMVIGLSWQIVDQILPWHNRPSWVDDHYSEQVSKNNHLMLITTIFAYALNTQRTDRDIWNASLNNAHHSLSYLRFRIIFNRDWQLVKVIISSSGSRCWLDIGELQTCTHSTDAEVKTLPWYGVLYWPSLGNGYVTRLAREYVAGYVPQWW